MAEADTLNEKSGAIIGAAIDVHRALGPGLLESAYESCLAFELGDRGFAVEKQKPIPIVYREVELDCGYRLELLVNQSIVIEVKAVDRLAPIHAAQLLSYLELTGCHLGLLIDFHVPVLRDGIRRIVHNFPDS